MEKFKSLYLQNIPSIKASAELNDILSKQRSPLLKIGLGYVSGSSNKQLESKESINMIKFQVSRQSYHVSTLLPKANKDKMILLMGEIDRPSIGRVEPVRGCLITQAIWDEPP